MPPGPEPEKIIGKVATGATTASERPDPTKAVGIVNGDVTVLPYRNPSLGGLKFAKFPGTELSVFTPNGDNVAKRLATNPFDGKPMLCDVSGGKTWIDISARLYSHALHYCPGMMKVLARLAPLARAISNSTGLMNSSHLLSAIRDWFRLDWVGGHLGKIVSPLLFGFNSGQIADRDAPGRGNSLSIKDPPKERGGD